MRTETLFCGSRPNNFPPAGGKRSSESSLAARFDNAHISPEPSMKMTGSLNPRSPLFALSPTSQALNSDKPPESFSLDAAGPTGSTKSSGDDLRKAPVVFTSPQTGGNGCEHASDTAKAPSPMSPWRRPRPVGLTISSPEPMRLDKKSTRPQQTDRTKSTRQQQPTKQHRAPHVTRPDVLDSGASTPDRGCIELTVPSPRRSGGFSTLNTLKQVVRQGHVLSSQKECAGCHAQLQQDRPIVLGYDRTFCCGGCRKDFIKAVRKVGFTVASQRGPGSGEHSPMGKLVLDEFGIFDVVPMKRSRSGRFQ